MNDSTIIIEHFRHSQIQYAEKYLLLYSAFNAWYRLVTGRKIDAYALRALKYRDALWVEYNKGRSLERLRPVMRKIMALSLFRPLQSRGSWNGAVTSLEDWEGMIQFWYSVRCSLIHANDETQNAWYPMYVQLAYESLNIFMTEIVLRLQANEGPLTNQNDLSKRYGGALAVKHKYADLYAGHNT